MSSSSSSFRGVVIGYWLLRTTPYVNVWLAAASLLFYATAGAIYLLPLLFTCLFDFYVGNQLVRSQTTPRRRKVLFVTSVAMQIGLLSACKYLGWLTASSQQLATLFGLSIAFPIVQLILPPGIS